MKVIVMFFLMLISIGESSAQNDAVEIYVLQKFEECDFLEFGGKNEFLKSVYRRMKFPAVAREWKKEKEGLIRTVLRCNGKNDYDIFTFSDTKGTFVAFHEEVERVLNEITNIPNKGSGEKYSVEMFFEFRANRGCVNGSKNGWLCIVGYSSQPKRNSK